MTQRTTLKKASTGLVGALAIAGGSTAYGDIVLLNLPPDILPTSFPTATSFFSDWDINGDSITDISFGFRQPQSSGVDWQANAFVYPGAAVLGYVGVLMYNFGQRLAFGDNIAPNGGNTFIPGNIDGQQVILGSRYAATNYGQFQPPNSRGFVGFQFTTGGQTYNGYIELRAARDFGIDFISAAYNNTPNGPITAGQVPEPGTLAFLALGAAGLAAAGRKRLKAKKAE